MTKEELLKPRFKVIDKYPDSPFAVGEVLQLTIDKHFGKHYEYEWFGHDGRYSEYESFFNEYPNIFKKLQWWEEREKNDMPKYVLLKTAIPKVIQKVVEWKYESGVVYLCQTEMGKIENLWAIEPSTEQEYNDYIKKKK